MIRIRLAARLVRAARRGRRAIGAGYVTLYRRKRATRRNGSVVAPPGGIVTRTVVLTHSRERDRRTVLVTQRVVDRREITPAGATPLAAPATPAAVTIVRMGRHVAVGASPVASAMVVRPVRHAHSTPSIMRHGSPVRRAASPVASPTPSPAPPPRAPASLRSTPPASANPAITAQPAPVRYTRLVERYFAAAAPRRTAPPAPVPAVVAARPARSAAAVRAPAPLAPAAPRRAQSPEPPAGAAPLHWRAPPVPQPSVPRDAPTRPAGSPSSERVTPHAPAASAPSPLWPAGPAHRPAPPVITPAVLERLADDVIARIAKKSRIERERRGR